MLERARTRWKTWLAAWPGECQVCGVWGPHVVCADCMLAWAPQLPRCPRCALPLNLSAPAANPPWPLCPDCEAHGPEFDRAVAAVHYAAPWSNLIARLKFQQQSHLAAPLGQMLAQAVKVRASQHPMPWPDVVLPLPVSAARLQERGFNQSWLLAQACANAMGLPTRHDVLRRRRHTARLMTLDAEARSLALRQAFDIHPAWAHWVEGAHVAVVDDVMTTGATLNEAARALREAGAASVSAWVVARTPT